MPDIPEREVYRNRATRKNYVVETYVNWLEEEHRRHLEACQCIEKVMDEKAEAAESV